MNRELASNIILYIVYLTHHTCFLHCISKKRHWCTL